MYGSVTMWKCSYREQKAIIVALRYFAARDWKLAFDFASLGIF